MTAARRVLIRSWFGSGIPTALDRAVVRTAVRRARRAAPRTGTPHPVGQHLVLAPPGGGSIGDQALLEALLQGTSGAVLLAVSDPQQLDLPPDLAERVELLDAPHLVYGPGVAHVRSVRAFGHALARAAHVSLIGADVMDGIYSLPASMRRSALVAAAAAAGVDARVTGFSWSTTPRRAARRELRRAGRAGVRLCVRDPASAHRLRAQGVRGVVDVADVVFAGQGVDPSAADRLLWGVSAPVVLVNASGLVARKVDLVDDYVEVVAALRGHGAHVLLLPHDTRSTSDDLAACRLVQQRAGGEGTTLVEEVLTPAQVRGLTARAALTITGRMHLAVLSLVNGVPAVTLATQGKVEGLARLFGTPDLVVDPRPGFAAHVVPRLASLLDPASPTRAVITSALPRVRELADANFVDLPRPPVGGAR